jgi:hypothetical protein
MPATGLARSTESGRLETVTSRRKIGKQKENTKPFSASNGQKTVQTSSAPPSDPPGSIAGGMVQGFWRGCKLDVFEAAS